VIKDMTNVILIRLRQFLL